MSSSKPLPQAASPMAIRSSADSVARPPLRFICRSRKPTCPATSVRRPGHGPDARMSPGDLCEIGLAARSLWERLEQRETAEDRAAPLDAEVRLGRWRQSVAGGDEHVFIKRLEWDGLEEPA